MDTSVRELSAYEELGVLPTADDFLIKAAYNALLKNCHTDTGGDSARIARVTNAYRQISDSAKRADYDRNVLPKYAVSNTAYEDAIIEEYEDEWGQEESFSDLERRNLEAEQLRLLREEVEELRRRAAQPEAAQPIVEVQERCDCGCEMTVAECGEYRQWYNNLKHTNPEWWQKNEQAPQTPNSPMRNRTAAAPRLSLRIVDAAAVVCSLLLLPILTISVFSADVLANSLVGILIVFAVIGWHLTVPVIIMLVLWGASQKRKWWYKRVSIGGRVFLRAHYEAAMLTTLTVFLVLCNLVFRPTFAQAIITGIRFGVQRS